jgi:hypothetical protein
MVFMDRMPMNSVVRKTTETTACTPPGTFLQMSLSVPVAGAQSTALWTL